MVVLTIVTQKNGETIFFDEPIPEVHFMKLISCSLYNSWDTLKREGSAVLGDEKRDPSVSVGRIPTGHHNLESMAKEIQEIFKTYGVKLYTKINNNFLLAIWTASRQSRSLVSHNASHSSRMSTAAPKKSSQFDGSDPSPDRNMSAILIKVKRGLTLYALFPMRSNS